MLNMIRGTAVLLLLLLLAAVDQASGFVSVKRHRHRCVYWLGVEGGVSSSSNSKQESCVLRHVL